MAKKPKERAVITYKETIYEDRYWEMLRYKTMIDNLIERKERVPARILKKYFDCFIKKNPDEINSQIALLTKTTVEYFSQKQFSKSKYIFLVYKKMNNSEYESNIEKWGFPNHHRGEANKEGIFECSFSFELLVESIYRKLLMFDEYEGILDDYNKCFRFIGQAVSSYIDMCLKLSYYKKCVISGFIASQLGKFETIDEFNDSDYTTFLYEKMKSYCKIPTRKKALLTPTYIPLSFKKLLYGN